MTFAINYDISWSFHWFPNLKCWVEKYKLTKTVDSHIPFLLYDNTSINGGRLLYFAPETIFRNCDIYIFNAHFLGKRRLQFFSSYVKSLLIPKKLILLNLNIIGVCITTQFLSKLICHCLKLTRKQILSVFYNKRYFQVKKLNFLYYF